MKYRFIFLILIFCIAISSCRREEEFIRDSSAALTFSTDSISFDTVFTTVGSITENFRVYNPHKKRINISSIRLNGSTTSPFRINVDGLAGTYFEDIEIASEDSIWVFLEVTIDPNNQLNPFVIEDFIEFNTNGNMQRIHLTAWGQNAIYYTPTSFNQNIPNFTCLTGPCSDSVPPVNVTWTDSLPIVVYDYIAIDTGDVLTIEKGTKIYFHGSGGMWVSPNGTLKVRGTIDEPVVFRGDRLEMQYDDIPGQWDRIWINQGGNNEIEYAVIENAFIGIQAEPLILNNDPVPFGNLTVKNTIIKNCSGFGILSALFNVRGENLAITDCGQYNVALQSAGNWRFDHCTFANYFRAASRETPAFFVQNGYNTSQGILVDTPIVNVRNSIIYGRNENEFDTEIINNGSLSLSFLNSIIKTELNTSDPSVYQNIIKNPPDLIFEDPLAGNFLLFDNSRARNQGNLGVANGIPFDLKGFSRIQDNQPDLGAYEYEP